MVAEAAKITDVAEGLTLDEALERIRNRRVRFQESRLDRLRFAGGSTFLDGVRSFELAPAAVGTLCQSLGLPDDLLPQLGPELGDRVLERMQQLRRGKRAWERVRLAINQDGFVVSLVPVTVLALNNSAIVGALEAAWPAKFSPETIDTASLQLDDNQFELSCYTRALSTEPRPGDVLFGGVTIRHSQTGDTPTVILGYVHRLACKNGLTQRVCLAGRPSRTRRSTNSPERTLESIRRQVTQAFYQLRERLEGVQELLNHPLDTAELPESLRRRWSINRRIARQINEALENDELGRTHSEFDLVNALARVATHSRDLTARYRRQLSLAAGMLAQRFVHQCPQCGNWLDD
jgi:hypothetical protein